MNHSTTSIDRSMKYIMVIIIIAALFCAEALMAQAPKQSRFSAKTLRIGVESFLRERLEDTDEFEIAKDLQDQIFDEAFVVAHCDATTESLSGSTKIQLLFSKNDVTLRRIYVPVRITLKRTVPVALHAIQKGDQIRPTDVELKLVDVTYLNAHADLNYSGKRASSSINRGAVITSAQLADGTAIQRGDLVSIVIQSGGVVVRANGSALDDAQPGQSLRVRRDDSSSIITATAGDNKSVYLNISQISPSSSQK